MFPQPSSRPDARADRLARLGTALRAMVKWAEAARDRAARRGKLHPTDFGCIGYLHRAGRPVSPKQIIAHLGLSSGAGTALLDRLEQAGHIHRLSNPEDRRGVLIALDEEAAREPIALTQRVEQCFRQATDDLSDHDLDVIARFLERIAQLPLDSASESDSPG